MSLLAVETIRSGYEDGPDVLHGIEMTVAEGEFVTLIGSNGAGKTTMLRTIMGLTRARAGAIRFLNRDISRARTANIVCLGASMVPEGRGVIPSLTVLENLRIAATPWRGRGPDLRREIDAVFALFPVLADRQHQSAWSLSGGQQQMLAIGRALVSRPKLMLLDEPSLGLAPNLVEQVFDTLVAINNKGVAILLVEQNAFLALEVSQRAYVFDRGRITIEGLSKDLLNDQRLTAAYLGDAPH